MTKDNWIKAFRRRFGIDDDWDSQLYHYLPSGLTIANKEVEDFISQVEKDAIDRGYKEGWNNAVNMDEWETRLQDAIEKTNKRWRERIVNLHKLITPEGFETPNMCFDQLADIDDMLTNLLKESE